MALCFLAYTFLSLSERAENSSVVFSMTQASPLHLREVGTDAGDSLASPVTPWWSGQATLRAQVLWYWLGIETDIQPQAQSSQTTLNDVWFETHPGGKVKTVTRYIDQELEHGNFWRIHSRMGKPVFGAVWPHDRC